MVLASKILANLISEMNVAGYRDAAEYLGSEYLMDRTLNTIKPRTPQPIKHINSDGWLDIESAPKDGSRFLITDGINVGYVYFKNGFLYAGVSNERVSNYKSTHWQPLPTPPKKT